MCRSNQRNGCVTRETCTEITVVIPITQTKRNNVILYDLSGNDEWDLAHHVGIVDDEQSDQPLVIEFNGDSGTMVMTLNKHGYNPPDTQAWDLDRNTLP
mgnify:CR=1 FL=1